MSSGGALARWFTGKKVLVTGGSSGIGKGLAEGAARHGAQVAILAENDDSLRAAAREMSAGGRTVTAYRCDLAKPDEIAAVSRRITAETGTPDVLINNAGFATYRAFEQTPVEEIERLLAVNLTGAMLLTRHLLPGFIARRSGSIVNVSSIAGTIPMTPCGTYSAAKHALVAWSEIMKSELARFNIAVNVVCPGRVETPFFDHETFRARAVPAEAGYTVPMAKVVSGTLRAIARNRFVTYIPPALGAISWFKSAFPFLANPLFFRLMRKRIESLYSIR